MSSKKMNIIAMVVLPIVTLATTAALFFMFQPEEPTKLFYFNLGYTLFLEALFFGYFDLLHLKPSSLSVPLLIVAGVYTFYYVITGFGWMLLYSLLLSHFLPFNVYMAGFMVLTLLWVVVSVMTAHPNVNHQERMEKLDDQRRTLDFYTQKISILSSRYEKICIERNIPYQTESNNRTVIDRLKSKISSLTPNVFRSDSACSQLDAMLDKCDVLIEQTEAAGEDALSELTKAMQRLVDRYIDELEMLKTLTRK